jgi:hypothetical protein
MSTTGSRKRVTTAWAAALFLLALPALVTGQSMGEAAKKERERRAKLEQAGASAQPISEKDLAASKGRTANDPGESPSPSASARPAGEAGGARGAAPGAEDYWRRRVGQARDRVAEAQARHDAMQRMVHLGQPAMYDEGGRQVMYSAQQLKQRADEAQAELAEAQKALDDLLEEARRAGALPGWLR